ncbi:hypothetical protein IAU60_001331 [Kwoniella sp. DSM 27419]
MTAAPSTSANASTSLSRTSSLRSRARALPASPSRLPPTHALSYFPPFEDMGSDAITAVIPDTPCQAGPSGSASPARLPGGHTKGRSLGSLAGIMSASLSWGLSSISCTTPPLASPPLDVGYDGSWQGPYGPPDNQAVQALTKRFTPGKRRVLEPLTLTHADEDDMSLALGVGGVHKRRLKSEVEVDGVLLERRHPAPSGELGPSPRSMRVKVDRVEDEDTVEALIDEPSSRPRNARRPRPRLRIPLPSFANWRFPLGPSSPVTSLSPDIPMEAFDMIIDNPCSTSSACRQPSPLERDDPLSPTQEEVDMIDSTLSLGPSASASTYSPSQPTTPSKVSLTSKESPIRQGVIPYPTRSAEKQLLCLERTISRMSEMSCETIKCGEDITPKASKVRRVIPV